MAYMRPLEGKDCPVSVLPRVLRRPGGVLNVISQQCLYRACCRMNNNRNSEQ